MSIPYCTNVHAGATLAENLAALETHAVAVRERLGAAGLLPIGWWISAAALVELTRQPPGRFERLREWFLTRGLLPVTLNGFPLLDFHGASVKHAVYRPDWSRPERLAVTKALATLLAALSSPGASRSVSTLPIGWPSRGSQETIAAAAAHLAALAAHLRKLREETGISVHVDLEPEPGCLLQRCGDVVEFFDRHLLPAGAAAGLDERTVRAHVGVCHDICHAAVMFEEQTACLRAYREAGILVGKVQVSSAIAVEFERMAPDERLWVLGRLNEFAEDRWLHQTMIRMPDGALRFYDDLPAALATADASRPPRGEWRVHYHVPVHMGSLGDTGLGTTQRAIRELFVDLGPAARELTTEIETYAWSVLPEALRPPELAAGIAEEIRWTQSVLTGASAVRRVQA